MTLTATASVGSFIGWTGYDTVNGIQCTVTMNTAKSVTATFALTAPPAPTLAQPTSGATEVDIIRHSVGILRPGQIHMNYKFPQIQI